MNHFEITHYVKMGQTITVVMPTVLNYNNDHIYYQRFYHYNDETCDNVTYPDGTDIDGLKSHVSLSTSADGTVQYYLYNNGMVTGDRIYWETRKEGMKQNAQRYFNFTNSDGNAFTVAADVSRYSDYKYENPGAPLTDDLEEPSLTMRYIYYMKDAKVMATTLTGYPEQTGVADASAWSETGTVCIDDTKWMEAKEFHFPAKPVAYENAKRVGYRGEFIALRHLFSDYWVFEGGNSDENLVSAVNNANEGKIEVRIYDPNGTGIMLGGWNPTITDINSTTDDGDPDKYEGFYFYDKMVNKTSYGDSRFVVFRYPEGGVADSKTGINNKAYIHVYLNNNGTRYQLAQFTLIFDKGAETIPWKSVNGAVNVEGEDPVYVQGTNRDPSKLRNLAGRPIAKIKFDYPQNKTYQYPASDADGPLTKHDGLDNQYGSIGNSSPIPLKFDNTNYAFDGDGCNWGSYALVAQKGTVWGNGKLVNPVDVAESAGGYGMEPDEGLQRGFLYIDASEQPGDICSADFQGEFCAGDKLMCSGWISGSNTVGGERCPGGITLTVKGERIEDGQKETIYRFCPGQCYELDNGTGVDGSTDGTQVVWQQFYFEFGTTKKYKRYWMEVNNNCVSSNGGDFMLDNVEVFALVPDVKPEMNTPVCVNKDASEMRLLKINLGFDKILAATNLTETTTGTGQDQSIAFVFLEKDVFLSTFQTKLRELNGVDKTIAELEIIIEKGDYGELVDAGHPYADAYHAAFNAAVLGDITKVWDSNSPNNNTDAGVLNFHWSNKFSEMETYSFAKAVNRLGAVFSETDPETEERFIVMNGNYPNGLKWKVNADYYIVPFSNVGINLAELYDDFN
ncbi:MAG: hypothetical protein J6W38_06115, partial [Prevotella sp.]|nr:hypothetical protein [Prevotella sp.]